MSAQKPVLQRLITRCQEGLNRVCACLANSLRVRFALTLTLLVSCVVIVAVLAGVVPDRKAERIESRVQVAEAVATLASVLLREGDPAGFRNSLQFIVERNPGIHTVVLSREAGEDVRFSAALSETEEKYSSGTVKTDVIQVPLLRQSQQWGELLVHFVSASNEPWQKRLMQARWSAVLFIPLASFVLFLLLPGKLLRTLMPCRPITRCEDLTGHGACTGIAAKCKSGFPGKWLRPRQKGRDAGREKICTGTPHDGVRPARILVVDDSEENRQFLSIVLGDMGHNVVLAAHGRQALNAVFDKQPDSNCFDLVFMNVQMPIMDGFTAVREMRLRGVRGAIVALASSTVPNAREKALAAGYSHFLAKPIDLDKMVALVSSLSTTAGSTLPSKASEARFRLGPGSSGPCGAHLSTCADNADLFAAAPGRQSISPEVPESTQKGLSPVFSKLPVAQPFFYRISGTFVESLPVQTGKLRQAVMGREEHQAARIAASIKGSAVKAGYPGFAEFCKGFNTSGCDAERDIASSLNELEAYARRVITGWHQTAAPRTAVKNSQFTANIRALSTS